VNEQAVLYALSTLAQTCAAPGAAGEAGRPSYRPSTTSRRPRTIAARRTSAASSSRDPIRPPPAWSFTAGCAPAPWSRSRPWRCCPA